MWARNGLSHPELGTAEGRILFDSLQPAMLVSRAAGGATLEAYLLARHRAIDALLERAIERGEVSQVIEVACGLSPRGWRFAQRYGDRLVYVEADLPEMAARKRRRARADGLARAITTASARSTPCETTTDRAASPRSPPSSTTATGSRSSPRGCSATSRPDAVRGLWRRFARTLDGFAGGRYISDLHLGGAVTPQVRVFRVLLGAFVRGRVYLHFTDAREAEAALVAAGFARSRRPRRRIVAGDDRRAGKPTR